jgi:hypothetical protein
MKNETANNESAILQRAAAGLQELNAQLLRSEVQDIANKVGFSWFTVNEYLKGNAPNIKRASKIAQAARAIIISREKSLNAA